MDALNRLLSDNLALAFGLVLLLLLVLFFAMLAQSIRLRRAVRAYQALVREGPGGSLHEVLSAHLERVELVGRRMNQLHELYAAIEGRTRGSIQHVGMVRFNPFEDTGSDQSFAIALLDARRDGVVISSLHGRDVTRVYAKPISGGASAHALSDEETQAIRIALEGTRASARAG